MVRFVRYEVSNKGIHIGLEILDSAVAFDGIAHQNLDTGGTLFQCLASFHNGHRFLVNGSGQRSMAIGLQPHESNTVDVCKHSRDISPLGAWRCDTPCCRIEVVEKIE